MLFTGSLAGVKSAIYVYMFLISMYPPTSFNWKILIPKLWPLSIKM